jgi:hypothetical protein
MTREEKMLTDFLLTLIAALVAGFAGSCAIALVVDFLTTKI